VKFLRLAVELALDALLIAGVVALVAQNRPPAPRALQIAHDPLRCSACTHPNARVGADRLAAELGEDDATTSR
jgi:hypothetical protein